MYHTHVYAPRRADTSTTKRVVLDDVTGEGRRRGRSIVFLEIRRWILRRSSTLSALARPSVIQRATLGEGQGGVLG